MKRYNCIFKASFVIILMMFIIGCNRHWVIKSEPPESLVSNELYSIKLIPSMQNGYSYTAFDLIIENKTNDDIELIWDKTHYISDGQTSGGFMFEGVVYKDRNYSKQSDIIFPKILFKKTIYPNNLVNYSKTGWYNNYMQNGENGIYLTLKIKDKEYHEKLKTIIFADYVYDK